MKKFFKLLVLITILTTLFTALTACDSSDNDDETYTITVNIAEPDGDEGVAHVWLIEYGTDCDSTSYYYSGSSALNASGNGVVTLTGVEVGTYTACTFIDYEGTDSSGPDTIDDLCLDSMTLTVDDNEVIEATDYYSCNP